MQNEVQVDIFRHTSAPYTNYKRVAEQDPTAYVDYKDQVPDISEEGKELAEKEIRSYIQGINPKDEMVVIISSKEARAYQTAQIFLKELQASDIEVFEGIPSQIEAYPVSISDVDHAQEIVGHDIPSLTGYSTYLDVDKLESRSNVNLEHPSVSPSQKDDYETARATVDADNQGGWRANYKRFQGSGPEFSGIPTIEENKRRMVHGFAVLRRLQASKKTQAFERDRGKKIRYIVVTHEENMLGLYEYSDGMVQPEKIQNCEHVTINVPLERSGFNEKFQSALS